jgi:hypothetical protein
MQPKPRPWIILPILVSLTIASVAPMIRVPYRGTDSRALLDPGATSAELLTEAPTDAPTATATSRPTKTPTKAPTAAPSATSSASSRPQVGVKRAGPSGQSTIYAGENFDLKVTIINTGKSKALNIQAVFTPGELVPRDNGGVVNVGGLPAGSDTTFSQHMTADDTLYGQQFALSVMTVTYTDGDGNAYTDTFNISIPLVLPPSYNYASPTPTAISRPQLVITDYTTSESPLEPGVQFVLELTVDNAGTAAARQVVMIAGGGSASSGGGETPQPGGISGGTGQFSTFAPVGGSNVQSLGDVPAASDIQAAQNLIVNVTVTPGAYPFPISFSYVDDKGTAYTDDQVITLLVYNLPKLDISFYRDPNPITAGQPNQLPLQVVNLGKNSVVLGNMRVTAASGAIENGQALVGPLDAGGYFTLDSVLTVDTAGGLELTVSVDYTDDFNAPRTVTQVLPVDVQEGLVVPVGPDTGKGEGEGPIPGSTTESFWQKARRFFLGILGLESGTPGLNPTSVPTEPPVVVPAGPGPKG